MLIFTHSLGLVAVKQVVEIRHPEKYEYFNQLKGWIAIAVAGVLPDLLSPHLSLADRYNSFSHSLIFTCVFLACCATFFAFLYRKPYGSLPVWCAAAYVLHLAEDMISGGIDFLASGHVPGEYYVPPMYWPLIDLYIIVIVVLLDRKIRKQHKI